MIRLAGSTRHTFIFPAEIQEAFAYYCALEHSFRLLPHVSVVQRYSEGAFRLLYHSTEMGLYQVKIFCDVEVERDDQGWVLSIRPMPDPPVFTPQASLHGLVTRAEFSSRSVFKVHPAGTQIDYHLTLKAGLPVPLGARLAPYSVVNAIAQRITQRRIHEIAGGFITRSVQAYRPEAHANA